MKTFGYVAGIIIVIIGLIEFFIGLFFGNTITGMMGYIGMLLGSIAIGLNTDDQVKEDKVIATPYYTGRYCEYCHIVRPMTWEKCDCKKTFK